MASAVTLFDKASANYRSADALLKVASDDEEQLNMAAYHLQQALELSLKYLLEQNGIEYPKTHDIDQLIRMGKEGDADLHLTEYVEEHAEMFSQWEMKSRYIIGFAVEAAKVERALGEVDAYLTAVADAENAVEAEGA